MSRNETGPSFNPPNALSCARILLSPVLLFLAWYGWNKIFIACLLFTFMTDALDGWLARKLNCQTESGAKLDSWADIVTWLALPVCGWWLHQEILERELPFLAISIFFYLAAIGIGFLKFRRLTSYHTYGAKFMTIFASICVAVFFITNSPWTIRAFTPVVVLTQLEEILITFTLSKWRANVPSLWHARRLKN